MDFATEALIDFINGKGVNSEQFLAIVNTGYLQLSPKALKLLKELEGAVHPIEKTNAESV
jgi:hypothetical protein